AGPYRSAESLEDNSSRNQNLCAPGRAFQTRPFPASGAAHSRNLFARAHRLDGTAVRAVPPERAASVQHPELRARAPRARTARAEHRGLRLVACEIFAAACLSFSILSS